ncbi:hypothetical protein [Aliarcobacter butzleri]|uniref:hypothetical protein n=1 Tax=Aliarcobacter butzleri TaxID=28197 RepID=UPI002B24B8CC|nr:hypothetical protein [Aliarcobacter butzleri]
MFPEIEKEKKKKRYIISFFVILMFLLINTITSIETFDNAEIESKEKSLTKLNKDGEILNFELAQLEKTNLEMFRNSIPEEKIARDLTKVCDSFKKIQILRECQVFNILSPFEYKNVATFTISTPYEVDKLIIKRLFSQIYNIKKIEINDMGVYFEIYNKI